MTTAPNIAATPEPIEPWKSSPAGDGLLGIDGLAQKLGFGRTTLYLMRQDGALLDPALTRGRAMRWDPRDVQAWIDAGCPTADEWRRAKGRGRKAGGGGGRR